ncbi:unnamed protein product [Alternaria alternata]
MAPSDLIFGPPGDRTAGFKPPRVPPRAITPVHGHHYQAKARLIFRHNDTLPDVEPYLRDKSTIDSNNTFGGRPLAYSGLSYRTYASMNFPGLHHGHVFYRKDEDSVLLTGATSSSFLGPAIARVPTLTGSCAKAAISQVVYASILSAMDRVHSIPTAGVSFMEELTFPCIEITTQAAVPLTGTTFLFGPPAPPEPEPYPTGQTQ